MRKANNQNELGYIREGEPTDAQLEFQDKVDNTIHQMLDVINGYYMEVIGTKHTPLDWDIQKITDIREEVERVLTLPDVY